MADEDLETGLKSLQEHNHTQTNLEPHPEPNPVSPQNSNTLTHAETLLKTWKYVGYQRFCGFGSSGNNLLITRRFGALGVRVLLGLQDEVVTLEEKLKKLDQTYSQPDAEDIHNGSFRNDTDDRKELLRKAHFSLKEYCRLTLSVQSMYLTTSDSFAKQFSDISGHPEPYDNDVRSLKNWLKAYTDSIWEPETEYITSEDRDDLIAWVPEFKSPLRRLLEKFDWFLLHHHFRRAAPARLPCYEREEVYCFSQRAMNGVVTAIIIASGLGMLLAPAWILEFLDNQIAKLGVISAFVILFTGMVQYAMVVRHGETLVAAAG